MLDKNSKKILKLLNSCISDEGKYTSFKIIINCCKLNGPHTQFCLDYLKSLGLITEKTNKNKSIVAYRSTIKGQLYFKNKFHEMFLTIFKSVICPLIVSFITTLTTLFLIK